MDAIVNIPELVREFATRQDFIAMYLGLLGFWCGWLAFRGLQLGGTRGFGWRAGDVSGAAAVQAGRVWLGVAVGLVAAGTGLWFTA